MNYDDYISTQKYLMEALQYERKCFSLLEQAIETMLERETADAVYTEYHRLRIENNANYE